MSDSDAVKVAQREAERRGVVVFVCHGKVIAADQYVPGKRQEAGHGVIEAVGYPVGWCYRKGRHQ